MTLAGVVQDADDARRPLVSRELQSELLHEPRVGGRAGDGCRPRVGDVREQRAQRDDEVDAEVGREPRDEVGEGAPAVVRLDSQENDRVSLDAREAGVEEDVLGPLDLARHALVETHGGPYGLEVDEAFRVDVREALGLPASRKVRSSQRGRLASVVPALEGGDQDGPRERGALGDAELCSHADRLLAGARSGTAPRSGSGGRHSAVDDCDGERPDHGRERHVHEHEPPGKRASILHLSHHHLRRAAPPGARRRGGSRPAPNGGAGRATSRPGAGRSRTRPLPGRGRTRCRLSRSPAARHPSRRRGAVRMRSPRPLSPPSPRRPRRRRARPGAATSALGRRPAHGGGSRPRTRPRRQARRRRVRAGSATSQPAGAGRAAP